MNADFADSLTLRILPRSRTLAPGASAGGEHGEISFVFAQRLRVSVARLRTVSESEKNLHFHLLLYDLSRTVQGSARFAVSVRI